MIIFLSHESLQAALNFGHDCSDTLSRSRQPKEIFWELRRLIVLCRVAPSEKSVCSWKWSLQMSNSSAPSQKFCRCELDCLAVTRSFVCSLVYCGFCCFWVWSLVSYEHVCLTLFFLTQLSWWLMTCRNKGSGMWFFQQIPARMDDLLAHGMLWHWPLMSGSLSWELSGSLNTWEMSCESTAECMQLQDNKLCASSPEKVSPQLWQFPW
jgi:hypothetical protein